MSEYDANKLKYQVITVEKTATPEGLPDDNWHRYVIGQGSSQVEGLKAGSLQTVTEHAETIAEDLNARTGKASSAYTAHKRK